ncbi:MAG: hypothetical protein E6J90_34710, partial [Deltaproteobacteria bacterium]
PDGSFAAVSGTLLPSTTRPAFTSSASAAAERALDRIFGASRPQMAIAETGETGGWQTLEIASTPDLQVTDARARRELARVGSQLVEAWAVEIMGQVPVDPDDPDAPDFVAHRYLVADVGGRILRDVDLVQNDAFVYRAYAETTGNRRPLDGATQSFTPHPTGVPDGSAPSIIPQNLVVMEAFNGPLDPWLATNAATTDGNNAEAFADLDNTLTFTTGDVRPEVKSGRVLNYTYDHTIGPLDTLNQSKAAAVNAFFVVNWMHDWWYDSGFTETAGNGQANNFGRGGVGNDRLLILAQAGANRGLRNNANMATPADGARPRMRMYLWTQGAATSLVTPSGTPVSRALTTGPRDFEIAGDLVVAADATAPTDDACQVPGNLSGKIALVTFSNACTSAVTVTNIKAGGAIAFVLVDGASNDPGRFGGSAAANLPGMVIGKTAGAALAAAVAAAGGSLGVTLTSAIAGPERDGDLDNTVVTHEWGHYLHHRLTDCGANQCGGMSEGWGDFNALMMMLREGDNRDGVYAIGPYALADGTPNTAYFGIRRFPYSRDRTRNDLSFRHISNGVALPTTTPGFPGNGSNNSEVHNAGEIWATMMWETLNVLADAHGVTVARRRMSDYIVGGMLLAPSDATFTEQRDGILAAASALDTDDMILMAAAFAGRGAGSCAVSPPGDSATNAGLVESGTLAAKLVVGGVTLTDDGRVGHAARHRRQQRHPGRRERDHHGVDREHRRPHRRADQVRRGAAVHEQQPELPGHRAPDRAAQHRGHDQCPRRRRQHLRQGRRQPRPDDPDRRRRRSRRVHDRHRRDQDLAVDADRRARDQPVGPRRRGQWQPVVPGHGRGLDHRHAVRLARAPGRHHRQPRTQVQARVQLRVPGHRAVRRRRRRDLERRRHHLERRHRVRRQPGVHRRGGRRRRQPDHRPPGLRRHEPGLSGAQPGVARLRQGVRRQVRAGAVPHRYRRLRRRARLEHRRRRGQRHHQHAVPGPGHRAVDVHRAPRRGRRVRRAVDRQRPRPQPARRRSGRVHPERRAVVGDARRERHGATRSSSTARLAAAAVTLPPRAVYAAPV